MSQKNLPDKPDSWVDCAETLNSERRSSQRCYDNDTLEFIPIENESAQAIIIFDQQFGLELSTAKQFFIHVLEVSKPVNVGSRHLLSIMCLKKSEYPLVLGNAKN